MAHSLKALYFHCIWSTAGRRALITPDVQERLYSYISGIARNHDCVAIEIGGTLDHVHLLLQFTNLDQFSSCIRDIKACSSGWIHQNFPELSFFKWQQGYGLFSVSYSMIQKTRTYIRNQKQHHALFSFEEELLKFLKCHAVEYDERFVFG
jgi:putative transposase